MSLVTRVEIVISNKRTSLLSYFLPPKKLRRLILCVGGGVCVCVCVCENLSLVTNIRLRWKWVTVINALAYLTYLIKS
jgi:hypothetical protein